MALTGNTKHNIKRLLFHEDERNVRLAKAILKGNGYTEREIECWIRDHKAASAIRAERGILSKMRSMYGNPTYSSGEPTICFGEPGITLWKAILRKTADSFCTRPEGNEYEWESPDKVNPGIRKEMELD